MFYRRTKKKDKDSSSPTNVPKLYLDETFSKESIHHHMPNIDLPSLEELVRLPYGLAEEEWLAWHSKLTLINIRIYIYIYAYLVCKEMYLFNFSLAVMGLYYGSLQIEPQTELGLVV